MKPHPGETGAGCEPPSRQTLQIPRSPRPTSAGHRGAPVFRRPAPFASARSLRPRDFEGNCTFSVLAPGPEFRAGGDCKLERRAPPRFRFHPDSSPLALDDLLTKCKPNASTGNFVSMQAPEHAEHPGSVLRIDTDSVVPHRKQPPFPVSLRRDVDSRCLLAPVLDRIGDEVLEKLCQH